MSDLISRQAAIDAVSGGMCSGWDCDVIDKLEALPSAQPRKGKWHGKGDSEGFGIFICDNCGKFAMMEYDFCPNCGADMRGNKNE